jgi:hypothetical protein
MKILKEIIDVLIYLLEKLKDLILYLLELAGQTAGKGYEKFLDISISEKVIFLNTVTAFFAVITPMAEYYIFESYFYINNPLAVYMIGIVIIMWVSIFYEGLVRLLVRTLLNAYYLVWVIYIPLAGELTKADPYRLSYGYYINIAAPAVYILASLFSYFVYRE